MKRNLFGVVYSVLTKNTHIPTEFMVVKTGMKTGQDDLFGQIQLLGTIPAVGVKKECGELLIM